MEKKTIHNPIAVGGDPFILHDGGRYYLYVTGEPDGYRCRVSEDLCHWEDAGMGLVKDDVHGAHSFWAPEILPHNGKYYMVYTSEEHIGVAVSDFPDGPFRQEEKRFLSEKNAIDGHFFRDDDGQVYLYYVRFDGGNVLYVTKMSDDLLSMDEENEVRLLSAETDWETRDCLVLEGPFVLKHRGKYYLTYSANHFRCPDYAVGYAVSDSPLGPFVRYAGNPILSRRDGIQGTGHHCFTTASDGSLVCVYHAHHSPDIIHPRMVYVSPASFAVAEDGGDDILVIDEPAVTCTVCL